MVWHEFYEKYWVFIDATIYSFAPLVLLTVFNIAIIRYLFKAADESLKLKENNKSFSISLSSQPHPPTSLTFGSPNDSNAILIPQSKGGYQTMKKPVISKYKTKSKTLTVSYMKTYIEEEEDSTHILKVII